jgi:hypothetical protein
MARSLAPRDQTRSEPAVVAAPLNECQPRSPGWVQWTPVVLPPAEDVGNVLEILNPPGVLIAIVTC